MAKYLVIVESPTKIKTIGRFLGKDYKIEASVGHVRDLPKSQMGVDLANNYEPKYITIRGKGDVIAKLKKEAKNATKVFLATDPDREGEAISWHLAKLLDIDASKKCRITFNEITKNAVTLALKSPRGINMNLVDAQQARRVLDRIVGYSISPLLWKKVRKGLSAGRVQSVATRLVVDRENEINNFLAEEYWHINAKFSHKSSKTAFDARFYGTADNKKVELTNKEDTDKILDSLKDVSYTVSNIKKGEKKRAPAPPFTTSTMQQEASRKHNFNTNKTMLVAQQLYEGVDIKGVGSTGLVTYIRTDSVRIADDAKKESSEYIKAKYGEKYLPEEPRAYKNKSASQDAHEAIRPSHTDLEPEKIKGSLTGEQYKLYKLIWDRFMASQMASALYDTVSVDIKTENWLFKASGSTVKFTGFMAVYVEGKDVDNQTDEQNEENNKIPEMQAGDQLILKKLEPNQHFTQPPPRYSEATLVKALEEKGIGRPSTYAPTMTTILARGYIEKEKKFLKPTEIGIIVNEILKGHFADIVDENFTAQMENKLDGIEESSKKWKEVIDDFYKPFAGVLTKAEEEIGKVEIKDEETDIVCEKCGRKMVIKQGRFGKFIACPGFPECRNTRPFIVEAGVDCPLCGSKVLIKKSKKGKKYLGCEKNPECTFMSWDMPSDQTCPECGKFMLQKGYGPKAKLKCSNPDCGFEAVKKESEKSDSGEDVSATLVTE